MPQFFLPWLSGHDIYHSAWQVCVLPTQKFLTEFMKPDRSLWTRMACEVSRILLESCGKSCGGILFLWHSYAPGWGIVTVAGGHLTFVLPRSVHKKYKIWRLSRYWSSVHAFMLYKYRNEIRSFVLHFYKLCNNTVHNVVWMVVQKAVFEDL